MTDLSKAKSRHKATEERKDIFRELWAPLTLDKIRCLHPKSTVCFRIFSVKVQSELVPIPVNTLEPNHGLSPWNTRSSVSSDSNNQPILEPQTEVPHNVRNTLAGRSDPCTKCTNVKMINTSSGTISMRVALQSRAQ